MEVVVVVGAVEAAVVLGDAVAEGGDFSSSLTLMNGSKETVSPAIAKFLAN